MIEAISFQTLVRERRSIRSFLPEAVPEGVIRSVLEDARHTPSNSNIQPWLIHIVSGETRNRLQTVMLAAADAGEHSPDFPWGYDEMQGFHRERQKAQGESYYSALGVARDALDDRRELVRRNLSFFGRAPSPDRAAAKGQLQYYRAPRALRRLEHEPSAAFRGLLVLCTKHEL